MCVCVCVMRVYECVSACSLDECVCKRLFFVVVCVCFSVKTVKMEELICLFTCL